MTEAKLFFKKIKCETCGQISENLLTHQQHICKNIKDLK